MNYATLKLELKRDESERLKPYDDATGKELKPGDRLIGKITLGTGRNLSDVGISESEVDFLLMSDIGRAEGGLDQKIPGWRTLTETRQRVMLNLCFNLGIDGLLKFHDTLAYVKAGDYDKAADAMLNSLWAKQVGARATRLADMMRHG